ncbi:hypothetical protein DER45DRAFT_634869 [Fusarium avenaceum]|nr:hypothetical protein DER45DRAFT_634869 [Fusarium avenaceum]
MTRNINLPDQSWSFQPSLPLGSSSGNLPANDANPAQFMMAQFPASQTQFAHNSWTNANNGFGSQAIFQQPMHPGNLPVQSAYPSARLVGAFTNNTLQQGLQQLVPVQGSHAGLAHPQGISTNFSQNFNAQNFNAQNFNTQNFDTQNFDMQNFNAQNFNAQNFNAQNFNMQNFINIPLDSNSLPAFNIQQNANGNPGTSAFQNGSSDCIPISQDVLQRSNSQDFEDTWHSFNSHSTTPPFQSLSSDLGQLNTLQATGSQNAVQQPISNYFTHSGPAQGQGLLQDTQHNPDNQDSADMLQISTSQDSMPERPRPPRNNQGQVGAPGIRFCVRCRSQLAYRAVWCHSCKQDISNGLPSPRHCKFCRRPASGPTSIVCAGHLRRGIGLPDEEKRVLEGEGICKRCYKADACPGILKCERCRADQKRYGATSRDTRAHLGKCLNCKKVVECAKYKNCAACRRKKAEGGKESRRRKANGGTE